MVREQMNVFLIVLARDGWHVPDKMRELEELGAPYVIVCGERLYQRNILYREPKGKWDAINFGSKFIPDGTETIVLNDVDTRIHNFEYALSELDGGRELVYCSVKVSGGPQVKFYKILDPIRERFHLVASGELMLIKRNVFNQVLPVPPCLAEDSYILFKVLELGYRTHFCRKTYVTTERTVNANEEEKYKTRTTLGIYQALEHTKPPILIRAFYKALPLVAWLLALTGQDGKAWARGIYRGVKAHVQKRGPTKF